MRYLLIALFSVSMTLSATTYRYFRIPKKILSERVASQLQLIEDHYHNDNYMLAYIPTTSSLEMLGPAKKQLVELDAKLWAHNAFDIDTLQMLPQTENRMDPYEDFHTYETLTAELKTLAGKYPNLVRLESAGKSVEGRDLWYLRVTNLNVTDPSKPKLLFISSMHGDEVTGKEVMVYLLRDMLQRHGTSARITSLMDHNEIYIMPSMNPDGTEHQQRFNATGVDLNRDFPGLNEDPFGGNRAPETRALMELHKNNHFQVAINFHGGSLCINIPWDSKANGAANLFGDNTLMHSMAREYADANHPMQANHMGSFDHGVTYGYEWYPVFGGMQDWSSYFRQSTHSTVEISMTKWPAASSLAGFWGDNREGLLKYLENGATGVHLKVTDKDGVLLPADIQISSAERTLSYPGYVHRPTVGGEQTVTVSSAGYVAQTLTLTPKQFDGSYLPVVMQK